MACGELTCMTVSSTVALALWIAEMRRIQAIIEACDNVENLPVPPELVP